MLFSLAFKHFCLKKSKQEGIVQSYCPFLVGIKTAQALDYKIWLLKGKSTQKKKLNIARTFSNEVWWGQNKTYAYLNPQCKLHRHEGSAIKTDHFIKDLSDQSTLRKKWIRARSQTTLTRVWLFLIAYPPLLTFSTL